MIDRFIEALNREAEMSAVEIADILWLAVQLQESESDSSDSSDSSPVEEEKDSDNDTEELKQEQRIAPEEKSQTSDSNKITTDQPSKEKKARIYPRYQGQTSKTDLYFKTPNAPSLRSPLTIAQQAFNPLIRRVPGSTSPILDEVATSQGIADTGLWLPVLRPTLEPWLDLELVVDESISMQIWRQTIIDLKKLLTNYGIFRDVRLWGLIVNNGEPVQIRRGIGAMAKNRYPRSPKELIDDSGRRLVLVASDCVSPPWRDGKVTEVLQLWAHRLPMAIIQMLPKWLWKRTALGIGTEVRLRGLTPGISNQNLIAEGVSLLSELDEKNGVKVPVFTLEADKAGSWAQMLSGQGSIWTSGVMFKLDKTLVNQEDRLFNLDYSKLTAQQRVQTFRVTASPMARKLAGLLAAAPVITLPVVRLIREVLLKDSLQVNMAEVFLGGLLKPLSEVNLETHPDQVLYDFMDGVRELLVDSVPLSYVKDVVDEVSEYVAKKVGLSLESFAAVLRNPQKVWEGEFTDEVRYFATVSPGVLRRLGGEFVQVAEELESYDRECSQIEEVEIVEEVHSIGKNFAITIGINKYEHIHRPLRYAARDAEKMRDFLLEEAGFNQVFYYSDYSPNIQNISTRPTRSNLLAFFEYVSKQKLMGEGDNFWFFFSGHSARVKGVDYICPSDAFLENIEHSSISVNYIIQRLQRCGADNVVMILDACREEQDDMSRSIKGIGEDIKIERKAYEKGVITIRSCSPDESSRELNELQQGAFTYALLEVLGNKGKKATVERLNEYLKYRLKELVQHKGQQTSRIMVDPIEKSHLILMPRYTSTDYEVHKISENFAITIGINEYKYIHRPLGYAAKEAEKIRDFLLTEAGFDQVFCYSDYSPDINNISTRPTRSNLLRLLEGTFEKEFMGAGDNFWFFFSGYCVRLKGVDYILPSDATSDLENTAISVNYIIQRLQRCGADNVVMILDGVEIEDDMSKSIRDIGAQAQRKAYEQGVITIYSCSPNETSWDAEELQQGAFTYALLEGLRSQGKKATVEKLNEYLKYRVKELNSDKGRHRGLQTPRIMVDPIEMSHLILMPRYTSAGDIA